MELTRPFYDKRALELAPEIPQDLYVRKGRNRYIACAALKDATAAEIAHMEKSEGSARDIDSAKIRALLAARGPDDRNSGWEQETQFCLLCCRSLHRTVQANNR